MWRAMTFLVAPLVLVAGMTLATPKEANGQIGIGVSPNVRAGVGVYGPGSYYGRGGYYNRGGYYGRGYGYYGRNYGYYGSRYGYYPYSRYYRPYYRYW